MVMRLMWILAIENDIKEPLYVDVGHGDCRSLVLALRSGLFEHVYGIEVGKDEKQGCKGRFTNWLTCEGLSESKATVNYDCTVSGLSKCCDDMQLKRMVMFSFMQGFTKQHVIDFITWVNKNHPIVVCIVGHGSGESAIASDGAVSETWANMVNYNLVYSMQLVMSSPSGAVTDRYFVRSA